MSLIDDDLWMDMLNRRNALTHDYDGSLAEDSFYIIIQKYLPLFDAFQLKAKEFIGKI